MYSLEHDVSRMFPEECEDIRDASLEGKTAQSDTVSLGATRDELLGKNYPRKR